MNNEDLLYHSLHNMARGAGKQKISALTGCFFVLANNTFKKEEN